jgi:hypothetical protein
VRHAIFPRLDAVSEITWSPKDRRDWTGFLDRLDIQRLRYARQGINAADGAFAVNFALDGGRGATLRSGQATLALSTQSGFGQIRYTLDGKTPTARSPLYTKPLKVPVGTPVRAAAFAADGRPTAEPRSFDLGRTALLTRSNTDLTACPKGALGLRVPLTSEAEADAPAFNVNLFDTCAMYPAAGGGAAPPGRGEGGRPPPRWTWPAASRSRSRACRATTAWPATPTRSAGTTTPRGSASWSSARGAARGPWSRPSRCRTRPPPTTG